MNRIIISVLSVFILMGCTGNPSKNSNTSIQVAIAEGVSSKAMDGRILLMLSTNNEKEPRFQIGEGLDNQLIFGLNVEGILPKEKISFDETVFGYPIESLSHVKPGKYYVQALLHVYETFHLSTGHTVKLPMDNGEGQKWNLSPGNIYSKPLEIEITEKGTKPFTLLLDQVIPEIEEPEDTEWIKHIKIKSEKLSEFWGRDMYLGAHILLPKGFNEHTEASFPLMIFHGHFPDTFGGFRTTPPDENLEPDYSERFQVSGLNIMQQHNLAEYTTPNMAYLGGHQRSRSDFMF